MLQIWNTNIHMLREIAKSRPSHIVLTFLLAILQGLQSIMNIMLVRYIIDTLGNAGTFRNTLVIIFIAVIVETLSVAIQAYCTNYLFPINQRIIQKAVREKIIRKAFEIDYKWYEDDTFFDKYNLAISQSDTRALAVLGTFSAFLNSIFSIFALSTLVLEASPVLIIVDVACAIVSAVFSINGIKQQHLRTVSLSPHLRWNTYFQRISYLKEDVQEIDFNPSAITLIEHYQNKNISKIIEVLKQYGLKLVRVQTFSGFSSVAASAFSMLYAVFSVLQGHISIGAFVTVTGSSTQLFAQARSLIMIFSQMYEHSLYIENYFDFIHFSTSKLYGSIKLNTRIRSIMTQEVSFCYPKASEEAIKNITVTFTQGEWIALTGDNGSGKSTFIKLLLRLYSPKTGRISINGIEIENLDLSDYLAKVGIVSQNCRSFAFSIAENILMRPLPDCNSGFEEQLVWEALRFVGLEEKIASFPKGIHTNITKEFDNAGQIFSGGELQKIMIARAIAKNPDVLIFDEAFHSLDRKSKIYLLSRIKKWQKDKIIISISHQDDELQYADRILVLKKGSIINEERPHSSV